MVKPCEPEEIKDCDTVSSGLDSFVAGDIEIAFLKGSMVVFSKAKNCRQDPFRSIGRADSESVSF